MKAYDRSTARVLREEDVDDTLLAAGEPRAGAAAADVMRMFTARHRQYLLDQARRLRDRSDADDVVQAVLLDALEGRMNLPPDIDAAVEEILEHILSLPASYDAIFDSALGLTERVGPPKRPASCPVGTIHWLGVVSLARKNVSRCNF
ncbi:MAG TPA: hypothetical protein VIY73_09425 [Polyangiaceae bacterium]